jgi:hypothetical protein
MHAIQYTKKPSITTLRAAIRKAAAAGNTFIVLTWGENQISLERDTHGWFGHGWIGRSSGQDLAHELTICNRSGIPAGRLIVKHLGA